MSRLSFASPDMACVFFSFLLPGFNLLSATQTTTLPYCGMETDYRRANTRSYTGSVTYQRPHDQQINTPVGLTVIAPRHATTLLAARLLRGPDALHAPSATYARVRLCLHKMSDPTA